MPSGGMDSLFRRLVRPMDARGPRGVMSRGKPVYRGGFTSPKPRQNDLQKLVKERYRNGSGLK